jgi:hypothetical protein
MSCVLCRLFVVEMIYNILSSLYAYVQDHVFAGILSIVNVVIILRILIWWKGRSKKLLWVPMT